MNKLSILKLVFTVTLIAFFTLLKNNLNAQRLTLSSCDCTLQWKNSGGNTVLMDNTEKVGIGNTDLDAKLNVGDILLSSPGSRNVANFVTNQNGVYIKNFNGGSDRFSLRVEGGFGQPQLNVSSDGNVSIGTYNVACSDGQDYRLSVDGKIMAEGIKVSLSGDWCDYVFEEDYERNSLAEVERYIQANNHLPNVPSAKEVEESGIDLGEMDATLLRQIEELWLHLIDLKKENRSLQTRLKILEQE